MESGGTKAISFHTKMETFIFLMGLMLSHVAVPKGQELKAADHGASLDLDPNMQNDIRAATGKGIRRHKVGGW